MFPPRLVALLAALMWPVHTVQGGTCWNSAKSGHCTGLLTTNVTKEQCCASGSVSTSWTSGEFTSSQLFYWKAFGGGPANCFPCKDSCTGVRCPVNKQCVIRQNQPKCVCAPDCSKIKRKGPVCGTDGHTYRNSCTLLKRACRKKKNVQLAYYGTCQKSCDTLKCPGKKQCLLDQNLMPHCVRCSRPCPEVSGKNFVCGVDGVTYTNFCKLRQAACQKGRAIPVAYQGKCKGGAKCENVRCSKGKTCLTEPETGKPRCTTCQYNCKVLNLHLEEPVCGTDNQTYRSWCHMMQASCNSGVVIETKSSGRCEEDTKANQIEGQQSAHLALALAPPSLQRPNVDDATHEPNTIPLLDHESSTKS